MFLLGAGAPFLIFCGVRKIHDPLHLVLAYYFVHHCTVSCGAINEAHSACTVIKNHKRNYISYGIVYTCSSCVWFVLYFIFRTSRMNLLFPWKQWPNLSLNPDLPTASRLAVPLGARTKKGRIVQPSQEAAAVHSPQVTCKTEAVCACYERL